MRFNELSIQTQREAPSNSRAEGFSFLVRAGYLTREGLPLEMARLVSANLQRLYERMAVSARTAAFFSRLGLDVVASRTSPEFYFPISTGANEILTCAVCGYASGRGLCGLHKQPFSSEEALPVEKVSTPDCSTIEALASFLHFPREKTAKALMYTRLQDGQFIFILVRGDMQLSEAKLRRLVGDVRPATEAEITAAGAVPGYASPVGLRGALVIADDLLPSSPNLVAGANQPGYHLLNVNIVRDVQPGRVADVVLVRAGDACPGCGAPLELRAAEMLADSAGIRFDGLLLPLAETHHDDRGLALPGSLAPFDVYLMSVPGKSTDTSPAAEDLYQRLSQAGISVLYDDRSERAGVKFNDADLIGCPLRITVGERGLQNGMVELKPRKAAESRVIHLASTIEEIRNELTRNELTSTG